MANIVIKNDERRHHEAYVLGQFGKNPTAADKTSREHAEVIAARTQEAYENLKKMER